MPVVKADAYGHGHLETGGVLCDEGAAAFASGSVSEAVELRRNLAGRGFFPKIVALLGFADRHEAEFAAANAIIPLVHSLRQLDCLEGGEGVFLEIALKFDTGMARLGLDLEGARALRRRLDGLPGVSAVLAVSHLASADTAAGPDEVRAQAREFAGILGVLREALPGLPASLCNSAGSLLAEHATDIIGPHVCRPGISLYGGNPFAGTPLESLGAGLLPAMRVHAPVMAVRRLAKGCGIGYGATFRAPEDMPVGIVAVGYADGFSRGLSNRGALCVRGVRAPVIGRVSMQMIALDLRGVPEADTLAGERAHILGGPGGLSADELAAHWGTISYETLCLLGGNTREYEE